MNPRLKPDESDLENLLTSVSRELQEYDGQDDDDDSKEKFAEFRICKNDYHVSAGYSDSGERAPPERHQSQITLIMLGKIS